MLVSWKAKIIYNKSHIPLEHAPDSSKTFVYEGKQFFKVLLGYIPQTIHVWYNFPYIYHKKSAKCK